MRAITVFLSALLTLFFACNSGEQKSPSVDTSTVVNREDTAGLRDAFDYNKPTGDTVPLDAPPRYHPADTGKVESKNQ
jgi:hypothetical protein